MNKLDPEVKVKWLAALRSGEYKQGSHYLQRGDEFCCLGVFCKVMDVQQESQDEGDLVYFDGDYSVLSSNLVRKYGFDQPEVGIALTDENIEVVNAYLAEDNRIDSSTGLMLLTGLNDFGVPFDVIADLIEEHL